MTDAPNTLDKLATNNPHLEAVNRGKWVTHWLAAPVLLVVFMIGSMIAVQIVGMIFGGGQDWLNKGADGLNLLFFGFGTVLIVTLLWVMVAERRSPVTIFPDFKRFIPRFLGGWLFGVGSAIAVALLIAATGNLEFGTGESQPTGLSTLPTLLLFIAAFMVQGSTEEIVTRGWLLQVMNKRANLWVALVVSALLFTILHGTTRPVAVINLILFSFFLGFYILKEGNILGACGWHAGWNVTVGNFIGLPVSGHPAMGPTLIDLEATGPEWLTGGSYGPEASVISTAVLLALIVFYLWKAKRMKPWPEQPSQPTPEVTTID